MNKRGDIYDNFIKWYDSYSERPSKYTIAGHFTREVKLEKQAVAKEIFNIIGKATELPAEIENKKIIRSVFIIGSEKLKPLMKKYKYKEKEKEDIITSDEPLWY